jgi:DHA3 family tetracycline resistance protein-like MFS transporter
MLVADVVRAAMLTALAVLSITGAARMWELLVIVAVAGAATAFFNPASDALLPQLLPSGLLAQANSLDQLIRPLALRLAGPALGGVLVAAVGPGWAFALDAGSYAVSAGALLLIAPRVVAATSEPQAVMDDIKVGFRYVFNNPWVWATLVSAAVAYLLFMGPTEVLLPYIVKHLFADGAADLGLIFAAGGVGSLACAIVIGQIGTPGRGLTFMYAVWTAATLAVAVYGLSNQLWALMLASLVFNTLETAGTIAWATAKQRHIPPHLLGRVSSLDWLISIGLLPVSYALTAPVAAVIGVRATLVGAGVLGALVTFAPVLSRRVRYIGEPDPV